MSLYTPAGMVRSKYVVTCHILIVEGDLKGKVHLITVLLTI